MAIDNQYRMIWSGISDSDKIRETQGDNRFRRDCHLVYTWLIPWADDDGRLRGRPDWIIANILPHEGFSIGDVIKILTELHRINLIVWYEVSGKQFIQIVKAEEKQNIRKDRYKPSSYPAPIFTAANLQPNDNQMTDDAPQICNPLPSPSPSPSPSPNTLTQNKFAHNQNGTFKIFWSIYPKKKSKGKAEKIWSKIKPDEQLLAIMIANIEQAKKSEEWVKEGGKYIPYPATWLANKGWEDEISCISSKHAGIVAWLDEQEQHDYAE